MVCTGFVSPGASVVAQCIELVTPAFCIEVPVQVLAVPFVKLLSDYVLGKAENGPRC